jgi:sulfur carrier protein ThiS
LIDRVHVRMLQLGRRVVEHSTASGTTLGTALEQAGFDPSAPGVDVRVNAATADPGYVLRDGDVVTLVPRIKGGGQGRLGQGTL